MHGCMRQATGQKGIGKNKNHHQIIFQFQATLHISSKQQVHRMDYEHQQTSC